MQIKLDKFEGPLSLLLKLIEQEELDITQISLAKIADDYVEYIKTANIQPDEMADFLVVAARLLLIKSKALLPYLYPEEEQEIVELEQQLLMYKEFLEAAKKLEAMLGKKCFMFAREFNRQAVLANTKLFSPPRNATAETMVMVFGDLLARLEPPEQMEEKTIERQINIEEKIMIIEQLLLDRINFNFKQVLSEASTKTEVIVSFLAVLELTKQLTIDVQQGELFEDILISKYVESEYND